jgi:hypothetical protein
MPGAKAATKATGGVKTPSAGKAPAGSKPSAPDMKARVDRARSGAEAQAKAAGKSPADIKKAGDDAAGVAKSRANKSTKENQNDLVGGNKKDPKSKTGEDGKVGKQETADTPDLKKNNEAQKKSIKDKLLTPEGLAIIAALGLTLALAITFIAQAAEAAEACTDCRDFKINITDIKPFRSQTPFIGALMNAVTSPSSIIVTYTCPTDYEPLAGKESFTFKDTGFPELDDQTMTIEEVLGKNKVKLPCGSSDCSALVGKKGAINPNCSDFNDRFNDQVGKAAEGAGSAAGSAFKGLFKNMGTILFVIGVCVLLYFLISLMSKS